MVSFRQIVFYSFLFLGITTNSWAVDVGSVDLTNDSVGKRSKFSSQIFHIMARGSYPFKKFYYCLIGNEKKCSSTEVMTVRLVITIAMLISKPLLSRMQAVRRWQASTGRSFMDVLQESFNAAYANNQALRHADQDGLAQIAQKRDAFIEAHDNHSDVGTKCCVCLEDKDSTKAIPCINKHTDALCLDCLSTILLDTAICPICRRYFDFKD